MDVRHQKADADDRVRAERAVAMRVAGMAYSDISERLGYAEESGSRKAVDRLLSRIEHESVAALRLVEGERLDQLQRAAWDGAMSGDLDAIKAVLRIMERRSRLFGLDAPARVALASVELTDAQWAEKVASLIAELQDAPGGVAGALALQDGTPRRVAALLGASEPPALTRSSAYADGWSNVGP